MYFISGAKLYDLHGLKLSDSFLDFSDETAPVNVDDSIVTVGSKENEFGSHYAYGLASSYGVTYNHTGSTISDATSDGHHNYFLNASGDLISTKADFSLAQKVAHFGLSFKSGGISYDRTTDAFWISNDGTVEEVARNGSVLSSFETGIDSNGLAFDPADHTLWLSDVHGTNLYQFNQHGNQLGNLNLNLGSSIHGLEFALAPTPEPATLIALAAGVGALLRRRRGSSKAINPNSFTDLEVLS